MKTVANQNQLLDDKIRFLKNKQSIDFIILKEQFLLTKESLKPINIIKDSIYDFKNAKDVKTSLIETAIGIASGYFTKKMVVGKSKNIFKKISGAVLQYVVSNYITNKAEKINSHEEDIQNTSN